MIERVVDFIAKYSGVIAFCIIVITGIILIAKMIRNFKRKAKAAARRSVNNVVSKVLGSDISLSDVSKLINTTKEAAQEPEKKSVFGATNLYLPKITKDFADFHHAEVVSAITVFVNEFLSIRYGEKCKFEHSNVESGLEVMINKEKSGGVVLNVKVHNTAISDYIKTNEYATITYQVALGYNVNGERKEERYKIGYTLKLSANGITEETLKCNNCGAPIDSAGLEVCPYCDARIIRDTRMSWRFTSINIS